MLGLNAELWSLSGQTLDFCWSSLVATRLVRIARLSQKEVEVSEDGMGETATLIALLLEGEREWKALYRGCI